MTGDLFMPRRFCGHLPDPPGKGRGDEIGRLVGSAAPIPLAYTLPRPEDFYDQKEQSCVARALCRAVRIAAIVDGYTLDPSVLALYAVARELEHPAADVLPDVGSYPHRAIEAMLGPPNAPQLRALVARSRWDDDKDPGAPVPQDVLEAGSLAELSGVYRIEETGSDRLIRIRQTLTLDHAVPFASVVDKPFERGPGTNIWRGVMGEVVGSHMMVIVGYGPGYFLVDNSWSRFWNGSGYCKMSEEWMADGAVSDFTAVTVSPRRLF